ncbi:hypothetical protein KHA80_05020 [Anaerobacillus sp. HL2]|nr:hypothetical protein KHA80_05020 [Anaerobacillus sp. HL2]
MAYNGYYACCARRNATTHVPEGGKIIPLDNVIRDLNINLIEQFILQILSN